MGLLRNELDAFLGAIRFFTRLPVPRWVGHSEEGLNRSARYFPLVGILIGGFAALIFWSSDILWPKSVALILSMAASAYLTGAFHEDGLSDMVDGLGGGWDKARMLEIMKDSRVGSYGVVALTLTLLGKFMLLSELSVVWIPAAMVAGHGVSRLCASSLLLTMEYVREDANAKAKPLAKRLSADGFVLAAALIFPACLLLPPSAIMAGGALAAIVTLWISGILSRNLGGYTGDCLGGVQQLSEVAFYLGVLAALPR
jgi:adenosylcobinamide-GDP ribazoletransferase